MSHISEDDLIKTITYDNVVPPPSRGRSSVSPWGRVVDELIKEHRQGNEQRVAHVMLPSANAAELQVLTRTVNRIRALGQAPARKDVSIHVNLTPVPEDRKTEVSIYITDKVPGGRPRGRTRQMSVG